VSVPSATKRRRAPRVDRPQLASVDFAAEFLNVHPRTVRRMLHDGELRAYRVGRLIRVDMRQVYEMVAEPASPESVSA
jgi:excisionase family DNA binding protein